MKTKQIQQSVFISGKISDLDIKEVIFKFKKAEEFLSRHFITVVNPTKLGLAEKPAWENAIATCFDNLKECSYIYMLKDWKNSYGAKAELAYSIHTKKTILFETKHFSTFLSYTYLNYNTDVITSESSMLDGTSLNKNEEK
jgi:Domain of unknown function (DUF4406)